MNERIKELFIQLFGKNNFPKGNAEVYMSADDLKEFAELIVRECAEVAQDFVTVENNKLVEKIHISPWHLQDKIKEHFGVE